MQSTLAAVRSVQTKIQHLGVTFVHTDEGKLPRLLRALGLGRFIENRWFTVRSTIYYTGPVRWIPEDALAQAQFCDAHVRTLTHELTHVEQWDDFGPLVFLLWYFVFPLPVFFSGRYWLERRAFYKEALVLDDVPYLRALPEILWLQYSWAWPKRLAAKWVESKVGLDPNTQQPTLRKL